MVCVSRSPALHVVVSRDDEDSLILYIKEKEAEYHFWK